MIEFSDKYKRIIQLGKESIDAHAQKDGKFIFGTFGTIEAPLTVCKKPGLTDNLGSVLDIIVVEKILFAKSIEEINQFLVDGYVYWIPLVQEFLGINELELSGIWCGWDGETSLNEIYEIDDYIEIGKELRKYAFENYPSLIKI